MPNSLKRRCQRHADMNRESLRRRSSHQFFAAVYRRLRRRSSHQFSGSCFQRLRRRSSHQFFGSCFPEAAQAQLAPFLGSCFSEAARAQRSPIFRQLFSRGCAGAALTNFLCVRNINFGYISGHFGVGGAPPDHLWRTLADQRVFRLDFAGILGAFWHALGCLGAPIFRLDAARGPKGRQEVAKIWPQIHNGCKNGFRTTAALTRSVYL